MVLFLSISGKSFVNDLSCSPSTKSISTVSGVSLGLFLFSFY